MGQLSASRMDIAAGLLMFLFVLMTTVRIAQADNIVEVPVLATIRANEGGVFHVVLMSWDKECLTFDICAIEGLLIALPVRTCSRWSHKSNMAWIDSVTSGRSLHVQTPSPTDLYVVRRCAG